MIDVVIAGGGPNGLMLAGELGLAGIRPVVLDPMPGPNPGRRANGVIGQGVRILDHRGLYWVPDFSVLTTGGTRRVAELARDGRPLLVDLTEHGVVSAAMPDADEMRALRDPLTRWFGIRAATSSRPRPDTSSFTTASSASKVTHTPCPRT